MPLYLIRQDGQSFGPFTEGEIGELLSSGSISATTETAQEGTDDWKPLSQWNITKDIPKRPDNSNYSSNVAATPSTSTYDSYTPYTPEQEPQPLQDSAPSSSPLIGVILIAILYGLSSLICLGVSVFVFVMQNASRAAFNTPQSSGFSLLLQSFGIIIGMVALGIAVFHAFIVYGLAKLRNWARIIVMSLSGLGLISQLRSCLFIRENNAVSIITSTLLTTALLISIIVYLSRPKIQSRFN